MATTALGRGFLAVVPPAPVFGWIDSVADSARASADARFEPAGLRWTRAGQHHLTLQFLGPVSDVAALSESVAEAVRGVAPFTLRLGGAGAFPNARRASVLWLGVREGADALVALAAAVTDGTSAAGHAADDRPFRAHLTLARTNRARDVRAAVRALDVSPASPVWSVDEVVLFDSRPSAGAGRADVAPHSARARFGLTG